MPQVYSNLNNYLGIDLINKTGGFTYEFGHKQLSLSDTLLKYKLAYREDRVSPSNSPVSSSQTIESPGLVTEAWWKNVCEICKKSFKTQNILRQHMRIHTGVKPFCCDICHKSFSQMASLKYHLATHSDERPYQCQVCLKSFKLKPPFKKHLRECKSQPHSPVDQSSLSSIY